MAELECGGYCAQGIRQYGLYRGTEGSTRETWTLLEGRVQGLNPGVLMLGVIRGEKLKKSARGCGGGGRTGGDKERPRSAGGIAWCHPCTRFAERLQHVRGTKDIERGGN